MPNGKSADRAEKEEKKIMHVVEELRAAGYEFEYKETDNEFLFTFDTSPSSSDPEDERPDNAMTIDRVPVRDHRQFDLARIIVLANRRLADQRERQYARLIMVGHSPEMARRAVQYSREESEIKLRKFRRVAVGVMKELVA